MNTKEALCRIGDKIESDADNYRNMIEHGTVITITEKVDNGTVIVTVRKES